MNTKRLIRTSLYAMTIIFLFSTLSAIEVQYKDYKSSKKEKPYFEIELKNKNLIITIFEDDRELTEIYKLKNIHKKNGKVYADETVLFDRDGMIFREESIPFGRNDLPGRVDPIR